MSWRTPRCSSPRPVGASRNPEQYSSGSQSKRLAWSKHVDRVNRKRHRSWDLSWTGEAVSPSGMVFCCISSSSVQWTRRVPFGGPSLAPISRNCKYCSLSVFALLPMHLGTLVTGKFTTILESPTFLTISDLWEIRLEVSGCGKPVSWAAWQISALTKCRPANSPGYPRGDRGHMESCQLTFFGYPDWGFSVFFLRCKANPRVELARGGTARTPKLGHNFYAVSPSLL